MNLSALGLIALALLAGTILPMQFAINSQLARLFSSPLPAASISFLTGTIALVTLTVLSHRQWPSWAALKTAPLHIFIAGGIIGAIFVLISIIATPRLGAAVTFCFIIAGQLISAMLIDHFGAFNVSIHPVSFGRFIGAVLVLAGAVMMRLL